MLDAGGYCPECGLNLKGERKKDRTLKLSGDTLEYIGNDEERFRKAKGIAKNPNRIISFGGGKELGT